MAFITIETTRAGVLPEKIRQDIYVAVITAKEALHAVADATRDKMRETIKAKTYRPDGNSANLATSITAEETEDGWGVGNINTMNQVAPYWYLMNYGGMANVRGTVIMGSFGPGSPPDHRFAGSNPGAGSQIFVTGSTPSYAMVPKNPVNAKNYIEDTANWASTIWGIIFDEAMSKTRVLGR